VRRDFGKEVEGKKYSVFFIFLLLVIFTAVLVLYYASPPLPVRLGLVIYSSFFVGLLLKPISRG
jgi:hypothetical protein